MTGRARPSVLRFAVGDPAILAGARVIRTGDETALLPEESAGFGAAVVEVRRASGAARIVARHLLREIGVTTVALPRRRHAPPAWPIKVAGSLAHDATLAVAAVSRDSRVLALGVDVEPAEPVTTSVMLQVTTPSERDALAAAVARDAGAAVEAGLAARRLVVAKEAAYKAAFALDGTFLDWQQIEIEDPCGKGAEGLARLATGRSVPFDIGLVAGHVVAVARIDA